MRTALLAVKQDLGAQERQDRHLYRVANRRGSALAFSIWALSFFIFHKKMLIQSCMGRMNAFDAQDI